MTTYFKEDPYIFTKDDIQGVPLYYKNIATSPCIHIRVVFDYGATHDEVGLEGTAHFLEHMMFKGSGMFTDEKATDEFSKIYTLKTLNASTSFYHFTLTAKTLPENIDMVIRGLFDMATNAKLREEDVENERKVIIQEIWRSYYNDTYIQYAKKMTANSLYDVPLYLRMGRAFGWVNTVKNIKREDLQKAKDTFLVKDNVRIFIAGNIENIDEIKSLLQVQVEKMRTGEKSSPVKVPETIGKPKKNQFINTYSQIGLGNKKQATIDYEVIFPKLSMEKDPQKLAILTLLSTVLNDLVYEKLRTENNLCYSASAGRNTTSAFSTFYVHSKLNSNHVDKAVSMIQEIIENAKQGKYEDVFAKNKKLIIDRWVSNERLTGDLLDHVVTDVLVFGQNPGMNAYLHELEKVEYKDTVRFAQEYFVEDRFVLEIIKPNKGTFWEKCRSFFSKSEKGE